MKRASTWLIVFALLGIVALVPVAFAAGPAGGGPNDPLMVPTGAQTIAPQSTLWFYFDYVADKLRGGGGRGFFGFGSGGGRGGGGRVPVDITVDAGGVGGLSFGVFTQDLAKQWVSDPTTKPVGQGTPYRDTSNGLITHDLYWAGGFNADGRYLVAVTNSNSVPVTFNMSVVGDTVTLYPPTTPVPTPTLPVPFTVTPIQIGSLQGKVVFETATGGEIWTVNGDGSNLTRVSHGIDPSWSPDGKQIVFSRWDNTNPGVFIANADGSNERLVFAAPKTRWPRLSPDGKYIVFSQDKTKVENKTIWKLGLVELATGKLTEPQCSSLCYVPSWGSDSATIVYTDPNIGILKTNAFEGQESLIGPTGSYWDSGAGISRPIVNWPQIQDSIISPNGNQIAYSMQAHDRWELNMMNSGGGGQAGITNPDPVLYYLMDVVVHNVDPIWSPDSKEILFLSDRNGKWEFFVTDPTGTNVRQVLKPVTDLVKLDFSFNNERMMDWTR